jgi:hypothetical protein
MCKKRSSVNCFTTERDQETFRVDPCIRHFIRIMRDIGFKTVGACCGHGVYPLTVICQTSEGKYFELISGIDISRTRKFYKMDSNGYYYIPELVKQ